MKLKDLAKKPELTEIILDDKEIKEKYGDALSFYVHDRLPIEMYTKLASVNSQDASSMYSLIKELILDEDGLPVMTDGNTLPMDVMNAAVVKVTESLGK